MELFGVIIAAIFLVVFFGMTVEFGVYRTHCWLKKEPWSWAGFSEHLNQDHRSPK